MSSLKIALFVSALVSIKGQDLTSTRTKHPNNQYQPYDSYYSTGYYPNTKFKPGSPYKAIPPVYSPSDICFNPNYYGFQNTQTSPVPQPNIYYMPNTAQSAASAYPSSAWSSSSYAPWTWNNYPYMQVGNPATPSASPSSIKSTNQMNWNSPNLDLRSHEDQRNETHKTSTNTITVSRPTISVKIVPPNFNKNATSITNISPELSTPSSQNTRLDEKTRKMIKRLLEMGSRLAGKSKDEKEKHSDDKDDRSIDMDQNTDANFRLSSNNEMVITPSQQQTSPSNEYPLPKTTYGNRNEPKSSFNRMKILTEFNPPA